MSKRHLLLLSNSTLHPTGYLEYAREHITDFLTSHNVKKVKKTSIYSIKLNISIQLSICHSKLFFRFCLYLMPLLTVTVTRTSQGKLSVPWDSNWTACTALERTQGLTTNATFVLYFNFQEM